MLKLHGSLGHRAEPAIAKRLHELVHADGVEYLVIAPADAPRRRLRLRTDKGTDCALILARDEELVDGTVVLLEPARAIVAEIGEQPTLRLRPRDTEAALSLGWHAGNLHWRVRLMGAELVVLLDGAEADYRARLGPLLEDGRVTVVEP